MLAVAIQDLRRAEIALASSDLERALMAYRQVAVAIGRLQPRVLPHIRERNKLRKKSSDHMRQKIRAILERDYLTAGGNPYKVSHYTPDTSHPSTNGNV